MSILEVSNFSIEDVQQRWQKARLSALRSALLPDVIDGVAEADLIARVATHTDSQRSEQALRSVFDVSRKLAQSMSRHFGVVLETHDYAVLFSQMGLPCLGSVWREHNDAQVTERGPCGMRDTSGGFACNYWREAADGFVMGSSDSVRFARHRSAGHGDNDCLDILFEEVPGAIRFAKTRPEHETNLSYGVVPSKFLDGLHDLRHRLNDSGVLLLVDGYKEGVLFYRLETQDGVLCGAGGKLLHDMVSAEVSRHWPSIQVKDSAPIAVYGGSS